MRALLLLALTAVSVTAQAAIYKWVDPATGSVVYSDQPHGNAQQLKLPQAQTYSAPAVPAGADQPPAAAPAPAPDYRKFTFVSPHDQETIRNTGGVINVSLRLQPDLQVQKGDRISLILDDQREFGPAADPIFSINGIVRGTHTLQAQIKDAAGQVVAKTDKITIFYKQHSKLQAKPTVPP